MQLHNAAGPPPTPTTIIIARMQARPGQTRWRVCGPRVHSIGVDFSSTITLEHYTWRELDLTPD